jgi:hypothetical protein
MLFGGYHPTREDVRWFLWLLRYRIAPGLIYDWCGL